MASILPLFTAAVLVSAPVLASETVPVEQFRAVELRGGGEVELVPGAVQRVTIIEGSSAFTHMHVDRNGTLIINTCDEHCPPVYHLRIALEGPRVPDLAIDGGGLVTARPGFLPQDRLNAAVNGGGRIDARSLDAGTVSAAVNGGGSLFVRPRRVLSAAVNGGGHVRYWGNPVTSVSIRGGGSVSRGD